MEDSNPRPSDQRERRIFVLLIALAILLLGAIVLPFWQAIALAAVLAGAIHPLYLGLERWMRGRSKLAAALITVAMVLVLLVPVAVITTFAIKEGIEGARFLSQTMRTGGVGALLDSLPTALQQVANRLLEAFPRLEQALQSEALTAQVGAQSGKAAAAVGGAMAATGSAVLQLVMFLIAFLFLLVDGAGLVGWLEQTLPLKRGQTREILREFRKTAVSVLTSTIATSAVQALAALLGFLIARVPQPFFFALVTFVFAFVPAIGGGGVCLAAALLLFLMDRIGWAIFLALWGILVVGLADNIIKPLLMKAGLELHGVVVFFALLGGLSAFGAIGLLLGPLILAFFLAVVRIYRRDFLEHP